MAVVKNSFTTEVRTFRTNSGELCIFDEFKKVEKNGSVFDFIEFITEIKVTQLSRSCLISSWEIEKRRFLRRLNDYPPRPTSPKEVLRVY